MIGVTPCCDARFEPSTGSSPWQDCCSFGGTLLPKGLLRLMDSKTWSVRDEEAGG